MLLHLQCIGLRMLYPSRDLFLALFLSLSLVLHYQPARSRRMLQYRPTLPRQFCYLLHRGCHFLLLCLSHLFQEMVYRSIQGRRLDPRCRILLLRSVFLDPPLDSNLQVCSTHLSFSNSNGVTICHIQPINPLILHPSHSKLNQLFILRIKVVICFHLSRLRPRIQRGLISSSRRQRSKLQ